MSLYEHVFLVRQDVSPTLVDELVEQFKGIIETGGGTIAKVESWGVKSLAYRIQKNRKAHFTLLNIDAPSAAVVEMERMMGINEDVLRFITIKVEEHEEGPSAMLQKRDRDDRDREGREGRPPRRDDREGGREGREGRPPRRRDDDADFAVAAEEI